MSKTYYCQLCTSSWTILFPLYWLSDPIFQAWFGFANLKLWKNRAEFGQRPKKSWKTRAKNRTNRAKNRTNRAKNAETQTFHMFHDFFAVQILSFHVFCEFTPCLNSVPIAIIIFECEIIVWGWEPVRYTRLSAHRTPALWFWHFWFAGRLQDIVGHYGKVSSGISQLCTPLSMPFKMCSLFQYPWTNTFCSKCLRLFF